MFLFPVIYIILVDSKVHATFQQNMTILFIVGSILPNDLCLGWSKVWSKGSDEIPSLYLDRAIYAEGIDQGYSKPTALRMRIYPIIFYAGRVEIFTVRKFALGKPIWDSLAYQLYLAYYLVL